MAPVLEIENMTLCFGRRKVIREASLEVEPGECLAIVGPNGCGKTTLLKGITGLIKPRPGSRTILAGRDISRASVWRRARLGLVHVLEGARAFPSMTVEQNLLLGLGSLGQSAKDRIQKVYDLIPEIGRENVRHRPAATLSGGEREMLVLGHAILQQPTVLMLDSPFMGAGPKFRERVAMLIADWQSKNKVSVLIVDHDIGLLHNVATRIVEMRDGKLVVVK